MTRKKWFSSILAVGLLLASYGSVFANEEPVEGQIEKENDYLHFTPITENDLSADEISFVENNKITRGIHQKGTLYMISLGEKPNAGYRLEFVKSETTFEQEKIYVKQYVPEEGQMYAQVIQSPYIMGRLQLPSKYMTLSVIDIDTNKDLFIEENPVNDNSIKVYINGELLHFDQPPVLLNNRTMVPLRGIFEKLGALVEYDKATQEITATKDSRIISLKIGSSSPTINGEKKQIEVAPLIQNNRTLIPLRFVGEALGAKVEWKALENKVIITN